MVLLPLVSSATAQEKPDLLRALQLDAIEQKECDWIHWGDDDSKFSNWTNHSNRLIPLYTFGLSLDSVGGEKSCYRSEERLSKIYGDVPAETFCIDAQYIDQTEIYDLQMEAIAQGKKHVILFVCDGMDWQTTQAAAIYKNQKVLYTKGRGTGLRFLDYTGGDSEFGFMVTSPHNGGTKCDVDSQTISNDGGNRGGGYRQSRGGKFPWSEPADPGYLIGRNASSGDTVTDSAASATAMTTGHKTFNAAIAIGADGKPLETVAHFAQKKGYAIGVVTSVPISHATPACAYSHNVTRNDYQDLTRDLLGLKSISHREEPLPGVDVLIGCGATSDKSDDRKKQGRNYVPGNQYLAAEDEKTVNIDEGGKYVIARRTKGVAGKTVLEEGAERAVRKDARLFGFFGYGAHLPFRTADGDFDPTRGSKSIDRYQEADIVENPRLADMTAAALAVLEKKEGGFWMMVEAGDIDWANHNNNIDDAIGAVLDADDAFQVIVDWVEANGGWEDTAMIFTADHGHMMVLDDAKALTGEKAWPAKKDLPAEAEDKPIKKKD